MVLFKVYLDNKRKQGTNLRVQITNLSVKLIIACCMYPLYHASHVTAYYDKYHKITKSIYFLQKNDIFL